MMNLIRKYWDTKPLFLIISLALLFRLLAVIFAKGWGMFDDHFIVIESSGSWVAGHDYNDWLPGSPGNHGPTGHNLFYPGLHFLLFSLFNWMGINDPQIKMLFIRLIHAAFSMITVVMGYKIAETLQDRKSARIAGLLLAIFWFMPWMSVRNLVEMACVPFLMGGYALIFRKKPDRGVFIDWFLAGLLFGLAVNLRPQAIFFPVGIGGIILFQRKWSQLSAISFGALTTFVIFQGGIDFIIWGKPFAELLEYVNVCVTERNDYISLPWYNYFLTIFALLIPPVSFFLFWGFLKNWKKYLLVFIPALLYFIFHSYFPNKQERFILPMIPLMIVFGAMGWTSFCEKSEFWKKRPALLFWSWSFFWIINTILLVTFTFTYSKKARVEAMTYLSRYQNIKAIAVIDEDNSPELMPKFYLNQWPVSYNEFVGDLSADSILALSNRHKADNPPSFILFTGDKQVQPMVIKARRYFPALVYETTIEPGFIDRFVHWLNPINKNRRIFIYRNCDLIPKRMEN
ncbi:MAG: glycosyltransferase family 39 protein [Bacteroidales bacterium]